MSDWIRKGEAEMEQDRYLYLSGGFSDTERTVCVTNGRHTEVDAFQSDHEEADSGMFVHIHHAMETFSPERVVSLSIDTDVAIMCPYHVFKCNIAEFFFKTGVSQRQRFIPMHSVARNLGRTLSAALPVIHALSGCDSMSAFSGIGKKPWLKVASQHPEIIERLCYIGQDPTNINRDAKKACVELVSLLYSGKLADSLDTTRYELFSKKNLGSERLPPTNGSFTKHLQRVNYQVYIWCNATRPLLQLPSPVGNGWNQDDTGLLCFDYLDRPAAPDAVLEFYTVPLQN